ncbi:MAG TPA: hypothetical protein VIL00_00620 [Pseudonocardiaceae bacterium]
MDYGVMAILVPPVGMPELDELQRAGVTALLDGHLAQLEGATGPDGSEIDLLDYRVVSRPDGADVHLTLEAPSLVVAEEAAAAVLDDILDSTGLLAEWSVTDCQVRLSEEEFQESFHGPAPTEETPAALPPVEQPDVDATRWQERLLAAAEQFRAFDVDDVFAPGGRDGGPDQVARLAAGALMHAVTVITDGLFYDAALLAENYVTVADSQGQGLIVLEDLPPEYADRYDALFTRKFLLASAAVATRLAAPDWVPPNCPAEARALRLFVTEARVILDSADLVPWDESEELYTRFLRHVLDGVDEDRPFEEWFLPYPDRVPGLHPYLSHEEDVTPPDD